LAVWQAVSQDAAERLLAKLRGFVAGLDPDERVMFAALVAPAVAKVWDPGPADEVEAFAMAGWWSDALPDALRDAVRRHGPQIEGLGPDQTVATGRDE